MNTSHMARPSYNPIVTKALVLALAITASIEICAGTASQPALTVKQIMNVLVTPTTSKIWGATDLKTDTEWLQVEHAALGVMAAGNLLSSGGAGPGETELAAQADWQTFNNRMIAAARQILEAVAAKDEEALFAVGNNALYPPCESCHQKYQKR